MSARRTGDHVELDEEKARAGQTGLHVRYVLAFSTILVLIGFAAVAMYIFT